MTDVLKRLAGPLAVPTAAGAVLTCPAAHTYTVKTVKIVNTDTVNSKTFQLFIGGTAQTNSITPVFTIDAGGEAEWDGLLILNASDVMNGLASGTGLAISFYSLDQS
jgi:hypothetical protein